MLKRLFAAILLTSLVVPALAQKVAADKQEKFDPTRDAAKDVAYGVELARKQGKRVLLDVGGEWCPWCHKLDKMFREDVEVAKTLKKHYVVIKINYSEENTNEAVLKKYGKVEAFPHLFVLDEKGKVLCSQDTGALESGDHHDHDKVMAFLNKWARK
ncbi:MAG: thioredoxin family protein [Fimbriimonadaceae bacterium]|nr:thioredoxin family protein [Fimbriimonadaceae bacterium]QYK55524.1 MAG: thioredoxin family protein [Fimbriimonadaceae bacterium]